MCRLSVEAYHGYVRVGEWSRGDIRSEGLFVSAVFEPGTELENYVDLLILLSFFLSFSVGVAHAPFARQCTTPGKGLV